MQKKSGEKKSNIIINEDFFTYYYSSFNWYINIIINRKRKKTNCYKNQDENIDE